LKTFSFWSTKTGMKLINNLSTHSNKKINIISKKWGRFYPIFHFSTDIQKSINKAEK